MAIWPVPSSAKGGFIAGIFALGLLWCALAFDMPGALSDTTWKLVRAKPVEEIGVLAPHATSPAGEFCSLAVSPEGSLLATGAFDGAVQLYSVIGPRLLAGWQAHNGAVKALAFSGDSNFLITAGADQVVARWGIEATAAPLFAGRWRSAAIVTALTVAPDGRTVALACADRLRIHDVASGDPILECELDVHSGPVRALAFALDGRALATGGGGDNAVRVWELRPGKLVLRHKLVTYSENWVRGLAYSADGATLVSVDTDGRALAWDREGRLHGETHGGDRSCQLASLGAGGRLVLSKAVADKSARLLQLPDKWWH